MTEASTLSHPDLSGEHVSRDAFRNGMAHLAGAVNIVTTDGPGGRSGFTASAVCSVTDTPPTLLVCVNRSSSAAPAFAVNEALCVNTVGPELESLARLFGGKTPMDDRFRDATWTTGKSGAPILEGSVVSFDCKITLRQVVGTHEVMFCEVVGVTLNETADGLVYFARKFHTLKAG